MKKILRVPTSIIEKLLFIEYADSKYLPQAVGIEFRGIDFGQGVLLFEIEHSDIVEDVAILEDVEDEKDS